MNIRDLLQRISLKYHVMMNTHNSLGKMRCKATLKIHKNIIHKLVNRQKKKY
jgi:hypothetical protein